MSDRNTYQCAWEILPVEIESGASLTSAVDTGGLRLFGIIVPSAWTTANLTFQVSPDAGTTWADMFDQSGNEILAEASPGRFVALNSPQHFASIQHFRIRSGSSAVPVSQTSTRSLRLVLRSL